MGATAAGKASLAVEAWWMRPSGGEKVLVGRYVLLGCTPY